MNRELLHKYIKHPELLDDRSRDELEHLVKEFPFFQTARLLLLKNYHNQGSIKYDKELKRTAIWTTDRRKLFFLLDHRVLLPVDEEFIIKEPAKQITKSISDDADIIDFSVLTSITPSIYDTEIQKQKDDQKELDILIRGGSVGIGTFFDVDDKVDLDDFKNTFKQKKGETLNEDNKPVSKQDQLIDKFIIDNPKMKAKSIKPEEPTEDISKASNEQSVDLMSDTLIKIYIKQEHYEKAIAAYEKLSLKYPKKNVYFADQIKKLEELINKK